VLPIASLSAASLPAAPSTASGSGLGTQTFGKEVLKSPLLVQFVTALGIDPALTHRTDPSLRIWYKKYNSYNEAVAKLTEMKAANTWTLANVGRTELINLFSGRSFWHSHVSGAFGDIQNHKAMVQWLEWVEDDEGPSDLEVWHLQKPHYTFKDLGIWKKEGTLNKDYKKKLQEKEKAKARQKERKEKNRNTDDSMDEAETSKKGRKVSGGKSKKSVSKLSRSKAKK